MPSYRWWLRPGDLAWGGVIDGVPWQAVYLGDDGTVWSFALRSRLGESRIRYDHTCRVLISDGADHDIPKVLGVVNAPLGERIGPVVQEDSLHLRILDTLGDHLSTDEWMDGRLLRQRLQPPSREAARAAVRELIPKYVRQHPSFGMPGEIDSYSLTLAGLLRCKRGDEATRVLERVLGLLGSKYDADATFSKFTLEEVRQAIGTTDKVDMFPFGAIKVAELSPGGGGSGSEWTFAVPPDSEYLSDHRTWPRFLEYLRQGKTPRPSPTAPLALPAHQITEAASPVVSLTVDVHGDTVGSGDGVPNPMANEFQYDVALSFAGEDRAIAEALAQALVDAGIRVFYDRYEQATLWGKDLYQHLQTIYRDTARYCVVFISAAYARKLWTRHELQQAQARAFRESQEYLLPLRLDDTELPGLNATVGYLDVRAMDVAEVARLLLEKLNGKAQSPPPTSSLLHGYRLADGHYPPSGVLKQRLAVPPLCGASTFPCVDGIDDAGQVLRASEWFVIESEGVRNSIANAAGCGPDDIEQIWSVAIGPPLTHLLVPLIDRQLVVLKLELDGQSFVPVELVPPFPSPGRCDTRAVASVDLLRDGGRQILLTSDGLSGSGLGQTVMGVYRLQAQRLERIFEAELDFNMALNFDDGTWEERSTTLQWGADRGVASRPRVHASTTRTLGNLEVTRSVEYEWNGKHFHQPNKSSDDIAGETEEARFQAEADRLRRLVAGKNDKGVVT